MTKSKRLRRRDRGIKQYRCAIVSPFGVAALARFLDGRVTRDGEIINVFSFSSLEAFRSSSGEWHAILLGEPFFPDFGLKDAANARVIVIRLGSLTLRRDSFVFRGEELPMMDDPNELLELLAINEYAQYGPYYRRASLVTAIVIAAVLALVVFAALH